MSNRITLKINEIFYSIQGESTFAGRPCVFIRLSGCNLRCVYCDTRYAYEQGEDWTIDAIVRKAAEYRFPLVEITGGEPLLQSGTPLLVDRLLSEGCEVLMETNGSRDIGVVNPACVKIVDIKCPGSGESHTTDLDNIDRLGSRDQVKFVLSDRADYDYAKAMVGRIRARCPDSPILFSAVYGALAPAKLAEWIMEDRLDIRLQLQLHKYIWPGRDRGV